MSIFNNPGLEGNPHFKDVTAMDAAEIQAVHVSATLALVYEQRTANLIAIYTELTEHNNNYLNHFVNRDEIAIQIKDRLGLQK